MEPRISVASIFKAVASLPVLIAASLLVIWMLWNRPKPSMASADTISQAPCPAPKQNQMPDVSSAPSGPSDAINWCLQRFVKRYGDRPFIAAFNKPPMCWANGHCSSESCDPKRYRVHPCDGCDTRLEWPLARRLSTCFKSPMGG